MERSFKKEVESLRKGAGERFEGEGILAVTKALLQSGVAYVGGYQGAPVSHLVDVLLDAQDVLHEYGVHIENCANEAAAGAMLGASINYPIRGAVSWKAIVGTNVASDALSNLASAGVVGGAMIVVGEDYGEGASIIQERSHAFAVKSSIWLLDPRPDLPNIVRMVEQGFELSEASNSPVMLELRIRACHVVGSFIAKDNRAGAINMRRPLAAPSFDYGRISHPPSTYHQEKHKVEKRMPAARRFIVERGLNEDFAGSADDVGVIIQGGLFNTFERAAEVSGIAGVLPRHVLNVTYPLVPEAIVRFAAGKRAILVVEEGWPAFIEDAIEAILRRADLQTKVYGKNCLAAAGEYTSEVMLRGLKTFVEAVEPKGVDLTELARQVDRRLAFKARGQALIGSDLPTRPPAFCTGCPERPVFSALKMVGDKIGRPHVAADIGCHAFATLPPFNMGNTILGYGLGLASSAGVAANFDKRVVSIMGDGGFWHNGLTTGVAGALFNKADSVLVVMKNGYTSATGWQAVPSSWAKREGRETGVDIAGALKGVGVKWLKTVTTYDVKTMMKTLTEALTTKTPGLKVIIAESECQLARQRRIKPQVAADLAAGRRVVRTKYGVDDAVCTGDHSCIRLSGCPSLTIKPSEDKLKTDPIAHVVQDCVGCGLCGEVAEAAALCPSFRRADVVRNAGAFERWLDGLRRQVITWLAPKEAAL
jgi:indolepyruvate ferredoxin oxidoreductase alpha subunit